MLKRNAAAVAPRVEPVLSLAAGEADRPLVIVVAGEFNAGKSSVIDLLLDRPVMPRSVEDTHLPPVTLRLAAAESARALAGGAVIAEGDPASLLAAAPAGTEAIEVDLVSDIPPGVILREVSVTLDHPDYAARRALLAEADALIWCTMAQRAWTLTESAVVEDLPAAARGAAILAVTRQDLLPDRAAAALVLERLQAVASAHFSHILLLDAGRDTLAAGPIARAVAGGAALRKAVAAIRASAPRAPLARDESASIPPSPVVATPRTAAERWRRTLDGVLADLDRRAASADDAAAREAALRRALARFLAGIEAAPLRSDARARAVAVGHAAALAAIPAAEQNSEAAADLIDLALQLEEDLASVATSDQ